LLKPPYKLSKKKSKNKLKNRYTRIFQNYKKNLRIQIPHSSLKKILLPLTPKLKKQKKKLKKIKLILMQTLLEKK